MALDIEKEIAELKVKMQSAAETWLAEKTANIEKDVKVMLDEHQHNIIPKLLGFNNRYDSSWELDHCNGRSGNSPAGDRFVQAHRDAVNNWLDNLTKIPALTKEEVASIQKGYRQNLLNYLSSAANNQAVKDAQTRLQSVLDATIPTQEKLTETEENERTRQVAVDLKIAEAVRLAEHKVREEFRIKAEAEAKAKEDEGLRLEAESKLREEHPRMLSMEL